MLFNQTFRVLDKGWAALVGSDRRGGSTQHGVNLHVCCDVVSWTKIFTQQKYANLTTTANCTCDAFLRLRGQTLVPGSRQTDLIWRPCAP